MLEPINQFKMYPADSGLSYPEKLIPKDSNEENPVLDNLPIEIDIPDMEALTPNEFTIARRDGFGGSDSSVLCGVNPYTKLDELIKQKTIKGLTEEERALKDNVAIMKGNDLEPLIIQKFQRFFNKHTMKPVPMYVFKDYPFLKMNFDGVTGSPEQYYPVEIKVVTKRGERHYNPSKAVFIERVGFRDYPDPAIVESNNTIETKAAHFGIPPYYYTQVQQEMMALNAPYGFLCSLWESNWTIYCYFIPRDVKVQHQIIIAANKAWNRVEQIRMNNGYYDQTEDDHDTGTV